MIQVCACGDCRGEAARVGGGVIYPACNATPFIESEETVIVIMSWPSDGSAEPQIRFRSLYARHEDAENTAIGLLIADIRDTKYQECRVFNVGESVAVLYDSTIPEKERKQWLLS